jgi:hypothetical protein
LPDTADVCDEVAIGNRLPGHAVPNVEPPFVWGF